MLLAIDQKTITILILICGLCKETLSVEYCNENLLTVDKPGLQFTKEVVNFEYGIVGSFKSMHCCATAYRTIEWYKDGHVYPWSGATSSFILYTGSGNQTIYTSSVTQQDVGVYTCRVSNQSIFYSHDVQFTVFDSGSGYTDVPLRTYEPLTQQEVAIGQNVRFYCEAFVGKIDLPDATNEIRWYKDKENKSLTSGEHVRLVKTARENGLTMGLYLMIDEVRKQDYGEYTCSISNAGDQTIDLYINLTEVETAIFPADMGKHVWMEIVKLLLVVTFLCIFFYLLYIKYGFDLYIFVKRRFITEKYDNSREYDVFLLYEVKDEAFVINTLQPGLQDHYGYKVYNHILDNHKALTMECQSRIASSRCVLVVTSDPPSPPKETFFLQRLHFISTLHSKVVFVFLQDATRIKYSLKNKHFDNLKLIKFLTWPNIARDDKGISKFWQLLRLQLPSKPLKSQHSSNKLYISVNDSQISHLDV